MKRYVFAVLLPLVSAVGVSCATEFKINEAIKTITVNGDLALRHENLHYEHGGDYYQERFRFRIGAKASFSDGLNAYFRLATAGPSSTNGYGGNQASEWQTETNLSSQKSLWLTVPGWNGRRWAALPRLPFLWLAVKCRIRSGRFMRPI